MVLFVLRVVRYDVVSWMVCSGVCMLWFSMLSSKLCVCLIWLVKKVMDFVSVWLIVLLK